MPVNQLSFPDDSQSACDLFAERSHQHPIVVFKKSPICPVSFKAEDEFKAWCAAFTDSADVSVSVIDVIEQRPVARGLTAALEIQHESPQVLWFEEGQVRWHGSHGAITQAKLDELWETHK